MGLETGTYISDLIATNPVGATDDRATADDHLRLIKAVLKATFPNINGAVTPTPAQLNVLAGTFIQTLLDDTDAATARTTLGLGTAAVATIGASGDTVPKNNTANTWSETQTFTLSPVFTDVAGTLTALGTGAASQAEMEAASDTSKYVTPGRQNYHLAHPKIVIYFNGATATAAADLAGVGFSQNVATLIKNGTGNYTINFSATFSSTNFGVLITCDAFAGTNMRAQGAVASRTTTSVTVLAGSADTGTLADTGVSVMVFGDFA